MEMRGRKRQGEERINKNQFDGTHQVHFVEKFKCKGNLFQLL